MWFPVHAVSKNARWMRFFGVFVAGILGKGAAKSQGKWITREIKNERVDDITM